MRKTLCALLLATALSPANAANLPSAPALPGAAAYNKAPSFTAGYPAESGLYFGAWGEVGGSSLNVNSTVVDTTGQVFDAQGSIGGLLGYVRCAGTANPAMPNTQGVCVAFEGSVGWSNINAKTTNGLSITGPLILEQGVSIMTPLSNIISMIPAINIFGNLQTPGLPTLPNGVTAGAGTLGLWAGLVEQDVSYQFNVGSLRAWAINFEIGPEMRWRLSNNMAAFARTVYRAPSTDQCVVSGALKECSGLGSGVFTKIGFDY